MKKNYYFCTKKTLKLIDKNENLRITNLFNKNEIQNKKSDYFYMPINKENV